MPKFISDSAQRIGIMGGTFDPVHLGHLAAAQAVVQDLSLDAVLFIPSWRPPHKSAVSVLSFACRCAMLDLALANNEKYYISLVEAERGGPSFTCDTLSELRRTLGEARKLFFITGIDAFNEIHTWRNYNTLPRYADFAILGRPPHSQKRLDGYIKKSFPEYVDDCTKFHLVAMDPVAISSTAIRNKVLKNFPIAHLTTHEVVRYIETTGLYRR